MYKTLRDNIAMVLIAHACLLTGPAIARAEGYEHPINFTQPIRSERGAISPIGDSAVYFGEADTCTIAKTEWGWSSCTNIDAFVGGMGRDIDSILYDRPVSDGYVKLDDFFASGAQDEIKRMGEDLRASMNAQSQRLGKKIEFLGWRLFPKADRDRNVIYYAFNSSWDGAKQVNIKVMVLDRQGYVVMDVIPTNPDLSEVQLKGVVEKAVATYKPNPVSSYQAFQSGDKVAAYGGLGVLATVLGVKYGKPAAVGLSALLVVILKKGAAILVLPFLLLGRLFRRRGKLGTVTGKNQ
jgi:Protein of unknown function (DUF2167)